ncbi:U-Asilidin(12)-Dg3b-like [Phlebotomus papatasi]|uniref:U-Asilidin(12)-Dg3b-like n=1 Tax=Phlebotomus papatasi TaxID=29031 RepID=UPI0024846284|nr:U-Asilidin(12)-Dg3b-like [Phlebotomus papatasi]
MSIFIVSLVLAVVTGVVIADPVKKKSEDFGQMMEENSEAAFQPRVTCDILGPTGWGDAACAAHCIAIGYSGGWCDNRKVCNCRR